MKQDEDHYYHREFAAAACLAHSEELPSMFCQGKELVIALVLPRYYLLPLPVNGRGSEAVVGSSCKYAIVVIARVSLA